MILNLINKVWNDKQRFLWNDQAGRLQAAPCCFPHRVCCKRWQFDGRRRILYKCMSMRVTIKVSLFSRKGVVQLASGGACICCAGGRRNRGGSILITVLAGIGIILRGMRRNILTFCQSERIWCYLLQTNYGRPTSACRGELGRLASSC